MKWLATNTEEKAIVAAAPGTAPWVSTLGGRRSLRLPELRVTQDDAQRRRKLEALVRCGRASTRIESAFPVSYIVVSPGDFADLGLRYPSDLERCSRLSTVYAGSGGIRVFRVDAPAAR
jgi:hypothetical protein